MRKTILHSISIAYLVLKEQSHYRFWSKMLIKSKIVDIIDIKLYYFLHQNLDHKKIGLDAFDQEALKNTLTLTKLCF